MTAMRNDTQSPLTATARAPRQGWIDTAKATAIALVVLGHLNQSDFVSSFLWTFHVPLFFFVSGFLSKPVTTRQFGERLLTRLALPYVYLYVANVVITALINNAYQPSAIGGELLGIVYGTHAYPGFINAALWFLPALMTVEVLYHLVLRRYPLAYLPIIALSYAIYRSGHIDLFFSVDLALLGLNYFVAGAMLHRFNVMDRLRGRYGLAIAITVGASVATLAAASIENVWYTGPHYALSLLAGCVGISMILAGAWLIDPWLQRTRYVARAIRFVSANTLFVLCFHEYSASLVTHVLPPGWLGSWLAESTVITILAIAVLAPFNLLVLRFLPSMIGVRPKPSTVSSKN